MDIIHPAERYKTALYIGLGYMGAKIVAGDIDRSIIAVAISILLVLVIWVALVGIHLAIVYLKTLRTKLRLRHLGITRYRQ